MALVAAITLIVALTLTPGSPLPYRVLAGLFDRWVAPRTLAMALNVVLFMPLGAVIGWFGRPWWLLGAMFTSVTIELAQLLLPDRNPLLSDVITNTLGACLGFLLVAAALKLREASSTPRERIPR